MYIKNIRTFRTFIISTFLKFSKIHLLAKNQLLKKKLKSNLHTSFRNCYLYLTNPILDCAE